MKRLAKVCCLIAIFLLAGSSLVCADNIDMIIMLDTSESVFPIFDKLIETAVEDTIKHHLQMGDYFHLLSFAGAPQIEVSSQINSKNDIENALKHIFLLQPLGKYTDLLRALQYLYHFSSDLPESRNKYIVLLTDGIHDPPPDSPFLFEKRNVQEELEKITDQINRKKWNFRIIQLPSPSVTDQSSSESSANLLNDLSESLDAGLVEYLENSGEESSNHVLGNPSIDAPSDLGKVSTTTIFPLKVKNHDSVQKSVTLKALYLDDKNILINSPKAVIPPGEEAVLEAEIRLPAGMSKGSHTLRLIPEFDSDLRFSPNEIEVSINHSPHKIQLPRFETWKYLLIIALVVCFGFLIFLLTRKMHVTVESLFKRGSDRIHAQASNGTLIELVVIGQNTQIGLRNVHSIADSSRVCLGGDGSPFVIFLRPFPRCIGEFVGKNGNFYFYPKKLSFFPEDTPEVFENCLNTRLIALSNNGKPVTFYFRKYISPLEKINRIMRLTSTPGVPPSLEDSE